MSGWYQAYWGAAGAASDTRKKLEKAKRLRMTKAERTAVEAATKRATGKNAAALRRLLKRHDAT